MARKGGKKAGLIDHLEELEFVQHRLKMFGEIYEAQVKAREECAEPITVTMPDGKEFDAIAGKTTPMDIIQRIGSKRLKKESIVAKVNGKVYDLTRPLEENCKLEFLNWESEEGKEVFWHSSAHVLGETLERLYKGELTIGPALDPKQMLSNGGFYYDMNAEAVSEDQYKAMEKFVQRIVQEKQPFERIVLKKEEALEMFKFNKFKQELIGQIPDGEVCSAYRCGSLIDLCRGPHIPTTGLIKAMSIVKNSATYWKNDAKRESLQRVYGISFPDKKKLKEWAQNREKALANDHRDIGVKQKLYFFNDYSPGSCFFLPHGARIYTKLLAFMRKSYWERGYTEVISPNNYNFDLWKKSGHAGKYSENMFQFECDDQKWGLKPMNCPGHCLMYGWQKHSYRELPLRYADFGVLHRNEVKGALTGLTRVRRFQQDDAHIFCRLDQIEEEVLGCLDFMAYVYGTFGFTFDLELSTRPEQRIGSDEVWDQAEKMLEKCLNEFCGKMEKKWVLNAGDGAFYGPKIDIKVYDSFQREHQCATVQLDFNLPERFQLTYTDDSGNDKVRPVMIHRAILGSIERFMAILAEHCEGRWPLWVSPRQVMVVPVSLDNLEYAQKVRTAFKEAGFHADVDDSRNNMKKKIAMAVDPKANQMYNYCMVVGAEEQGSNSVNIRKRGTTKGDMPLGVMTLDAAIEKLKKEVDNYE